MKKNTISIYIAAVMCIAATQKSGAQVMDYKEVAESIQKMGNYTIALAEKMPAEFFDFTPVEGLRTFAGQMNHISGSNYSYSEALNGGKPVFLDPQKKDESIKYLKDSFDHVRKAVLNLGNAGLYEEIERNNVSTPRFKVLLSMINHMTHTRGIAIMYLRAKGFAPPRYSGW